MSGSRLRSRRSHTVAAIVTSLATLGGCAETISQPTTARHVVAQTDAGVDSSPGALAGPVAPVQQALNGLVAAGIPGAALYMRDTAGNTRTLTAGVGNRSPSTPIDPDGLMMLASITKSYVGTIAVQLAEDGQLSLDDKVSRWVPGILPYANKITLRQLLQHTAGVNTDEEQPTLYPYWGLTWGSCIKKGICWWQPIDLVRAFDNLPQEFPAGTKYEYSSNGYDVAGLVLEAASGQSLGTLIQQRIVQRLGLQHSTFPDSWTQPPPGLVHGFANITGGPALEDVYGKMPIATWAEGAMFASVSDVAAFFAGLFGGQLVSPAGLVQMQTASPVSQGYGLGIYKSRRNGRVWWGHTGRTLGFESIAWHDPSTGAAIVLIHNASWYPNANKVNTAWYAVEREANKWIK